MRISAGELLGIGTGLGVRGAIGVAFEGNGRHGYDWTLRKPLLQIVEFRVAFGEVEGGLASPRQWREIMVNPFVSGDISSPTPNEPS